MNSQDEIVVVEDAFVRNFLRVALERQGHKVCCATPAQAADRLRSGNTALLITNTPTAFAEFGKAVPLLYLSASPDPAAAASFARWQSLRKPFQNSEFLALVDHLMQPV